MHATERCFILRRNFLAFWKHKMVVQETFKEAQNMPTNNPKEKKARRVFNLVEIFLSKFCQFCRYK